MGGIAGAVLRFSASKTTCCQKSSVRHGVGSSFQARPCRFWQPEQPKHDFNVPHAEVLAPHTIYQ